MPSPRESADPTARRNQVVTMVTDAELAVIQRVMRRYGMSKSTAARLLIVAGAPEHDPSPPEENHT